MIFVNFDEANKIVTVNFENPAVNHLNRIYENSELLIRDQYYLICNEELKSKKSFGISQRKMLLPFNNTVVTFQTKVNDIT